MRPPAAGWGAKDSVGIVFLSSGSSRSVQVSTISPVICPATSQCYWFGYFVHPLIWIWFIQYILVFSEDNCYRLHWVIPSHRGRDPFLALGFIRKISCNG